MTQNIYWLLRKFIKTSIFSVKKLLYKLSVKIHIKTSMIHTKRNMLLEVPKQILFNIIFFTLTLSADKLISSLFNNVPTINQNLISDILISMVGIAGVFLGLYCSYIATVFSSKYVNAPQEISNLFRDDSINTKSIQSITNYMIFSIIAIVSNMCFENLGFITVIVNLVMSIYMIVSYVFLGKRILGMSDTYFVAQSIYRIFFREFKKISNHSIYTNDKSFQNHIKSIAYKNIELLRIINLYNIESTESKSISIYNFLINNLSLLYSYLLIKKNIPYDSLWFKTNEYKKWYYANDTEIELALNTGTFLGNSETEDKYWFEKEILSINEICLNKLIEKKEFGLIRKYISCLEEVVSISIKSYDIHYFVEYISNIQNRLENILIDTTIEIDDELAITETYLMLYIKCAIDIRKNAESLDVKEILDYSIKHTKFHKYKHSVFFNNAIVKKIYMGISAELKIENKRITPDWYIKQYISRFIYNEIVLYCKSIELINRYIIDLAEKLFDMKKFSSATLVYSKYVEWYHKISGVLPYIEKLLNDTKSNHKETNNYVWETYDFKTFRTNLSKTYNEIPIKWSKCAAAFAIQNWDEYDNFPDMLGACYNNICNYLVHAIANDDFDSFEKTYPTFLGLVTLYQELSKKELSKIKEPFKQDMVLAVLSNPILDFGNISGYAILWGEISNDNRWCELIQDSFKKTLESYKENSEHLCNQISSFLSIPNMLRPAIYNRSIIRTSWKMTIEKAILSSGQIEWEHKRFSEVIKTDNKWLKRLIGTRSDYELMCSEAYEIFGVLVLNNYLPDDKKYKSTSGWENVL